MHYNLFGWNELSMIKVAIIVSTAYNQIQRTISYYRLYNIP